LADFDLYDEDTIDQFCLIFYDPEQPAELLQGVLDTVVEKWSELETNDEKEEFRSALQSYIRLYGYISQLITFTDPALEKLYVFGRNLNQKLPKREHPDLREVLESVDLDSFRVEKVHENIELPLEARDGEIIGIGSDVHTVRDPVEDLLSQIIQTLNETFQTDFTVEDKVDIETMRQKVHEHEELRQVRTGDNTETNRRYKFDQVFDDILLEFVESKLELYNKLSRPEINDFLKRHLYQDYFEQER
jgi:type I restriction enzyme R subunit